MNKLTHLLLTMFLCFVPSLMMAQDDNSRYLVGAVPEVDGKVVFSKEFSIPGMSQEKIYERMNNWLTARLKKNNNTDSRVVFTDQEKGTIAGVGEEWIVFKSSALALDRTMVNYQVTINCSPSKCEIEIGKIRYTYQEKEKYMAEEWIVDKYALNKSKTKLVRGLAKWRIKTVDFADDLFEEAAKALGAPDKAEKPAETQPKPVTSSGPVVIVPATQVTVAPAKTGTSQKQEVEDAPAPQIPPTVAQSPIIINTPVIQKEEIPGYKTIAPSELPKNAIQMGTGGRLVIVIGKDAFNMSMMTADAGGSLGQIGGKPVVFSFLAPEQPYEQMEKAETYTIRYYQAQQNEPSIVLECKKLPSQAPMEGQPRMYVGEILKAWTK